MPVQADAYKKELWMKAIEAGNEGDHEAQALLAHLCAPKL